MNRMWQGRAPSGAMITQLAGAVGLLTIASMLTALPSAAAALGTAIACPASAPDQSAADRAAGACGMGALRPWHLILTTLCCLGVAGIIAAVVLLVRCR